MKKFVFDVITIKDVGEVTKVWCIFQKRDGTFFDSLSRHSCDEEGKQSRRLN